jgi:DNA adenine methylase
MSITPPFAYYGGKTTLATTIADLLPEHDHYVEPFAGSLAVLLAKPQSRAETVNDLDGDLMTFWRVLRDRPEELEWVCTLTPHSRAEYLESRESLPADDLERARRVWVRLTQGRNQTVGRGRSGGWKFGTNASARSPQEFTKRLVAFADRIPACAQRLRMVSLECRDALDVIRDYGSEPSACLYVDPPYLGTTRATNYRHELTTDDEHRRRPVGLRRPAV